MITLETAVAFALRDISVMDSLGEALRSDLVVANPFLRRLVEFADDFLSARRKLPADGDWSAWMETLPEGNVRDGVREALGRVLIVDTSGHDPAYFSEVVIEQLRLGAAQVARARLNQMTDVTPDTFSELARRMEEIKPANLGGIARLSDVDVWAVPHQEGEKIPTGFPTLDKMIGGWGHELVIIFADSKAGKSMMLQNWASAAAVRGKRVLHITLELGLRPQILRYYRQIAQATRSEMSEDIDEIKRRLRHWLRLSKGEVTLLELPAYSTDLGEIRRAVERMVRVHGEVEVLVLDYMDLVHLGREKSRRNVYEDLGVLTHELRGFCKEFDMTVLTASQAVRKPQHKDRLTIKDMGDSYGKVRGADVLLSLCQSEEEAEIYQGRMGVLAVRDGIGGGKEVPLYINRDMSVIAELSHPNTVQLMTRLGHLPSQQPPPAMSMSTP